MLSCCPVFWWTWCSVEQTSPECSTENVGNKKTVVSELFIRPLSERITLDHDVRLLRISAAWFSTQPLTQCFRCYFRSTDRRERDRVFCVLSDGLFWLVAEERRGLDSLGGARPEVWRVRLGGCSLHRDLRKKLATTSGSCMASINGFVCRWFLRHEWTW